MPASHPTTTAANRDADAVWLQEFIDRELAAGRTGSPGMIRKMVEDVFHRYDDHVHDPAPEPTAEQAAVDATSYRVGCLALRRAMILIEGVVTDNKIARWADWVEADHVRAVLQYLDDQLKLLDDSITGMAAITPVLNFERRVREAVRITTPWFETAPGGVPEPVVNVMRFALDLEAMEARLHLYREAGGMNAGKEDTASDVAKWVGDAACEVRTNIMAEILTDAPTDQQVKLSRILAGAITSMEGAAEE